MRSIRSPQVGTWEGTVLLGLLASLGQREPVPTETTQKVFGISASIIDRYIARINHTFLENKRNHKRNRRWGVC